MNRPIRRVSTAVGVLLLALLLNLNWVQVVKSDTYRNHNSNRRVILNEYSNPRGQIIVQGKAIAESVETSDQLKFLRKYPQGLLYAPITGRYSLIFGASGMERAKNGLLAGTDGRLVASRFTDMLTGRDPKGGSVELTLNAKAQEAAFEALGNQKGAVVALDPATGAILAAASNPSYDPNTLSSHDADAINAAWKRLTEDPRGPLANRALQETYPPGSVFKVIVAAAALERGVKPSDVIKAPDRLPLPGSTIDLENFEGATCGAGGKTTLDNALTISCNTAFANLCLEYDEQVIRDKAALFGIDDEDRTVPLAVVKSTLGTIIDKAALAQSCIGQRDVRITPLQGAMIAAAVANQGVLMEPYLVATERRPNLSVLEQAKPTQLGDEVLDPELSRQLIEMMSHVVQRGTGQGAQIDIPGYLVGGKTGTADTGKVDRQGRPAEPAHSWFVGFALQNGVPKIAVSVLVEGGPGGGDGAGGVTSEGTAKRVFEAYLRATN